MTFNELIDIAQEEKSLSLKDVSLVLKNLMQDSDVDYVQYSYTQSPRKKYRDIARMIKNPELKIFAGSDDFHNLAVDYVHMNMFDCAIWILDRGLTYSSCSSDLLADKLLYGTESSQTDICEEAYNQLMCLDKNSWGWRAYSFTLDYYLEKANRLPKGKDREKIKEETIRMAEEFISYAKRYPEDIDRAFFEKAKAIKVFGSEKETEEDVLQAGCNATIAAPRCALRLADILFDRGNYDGSLLYLNQCIQTMLAPQPGVNHSYVFLLSALSKVSKLFSETSIGDCENKESLVKSVYKDFHTALADPEINPTYKKAAKTTIKVLEVQTGYKDMTAASESDEYI